MSDDDDQRFATKQGLFGWKGFAKDKKNETTKFTISLVVNFILFFYTFSELGTKDASGKFHYFEGPITTQYYLLCGVTVLVCAISATFIRYDDFGTRWGARFFACRLPALFVVFIPFVWGK